MDDAMTMLAPAIMAIAASILGLFYPYAIKRRAHASKPTERRL